MDAQQWLVFLPAAVLVAASPGANNFLALANGMRSGLEAAVGALAGWLATHRAARRLRLRREPWPSPRGGR